MESYTETTVTQYTERRRITTSFLSGHIINLSLL